MNRITRQAALFGAGLMMTLPAHAHGQEVMVVMYAQALAVVATIIALLPSRKTRQHWPSGLAGCLIGVGISWWITGDMPVHRNMELITGLQTGLPVIIAGLFVYLAKVLKRSS